MRKGITIFFKNRILLWVVKFGAGNSREDKIKPWELTAKILTSITTA
jgi:hypothetical protein